MSRLQRFERVLAYYGKHEASIMDSPRDWFDDAYSWDHEAGITLTPIERALWHDIRAEDLVPYPQYPVGRFFVDFGNPVWKVAIECDGARWHTDAERDAKRQQQIEAFGWKVYRITGRDCLTDEQEVAAENGRPSLRASVARLFVRAVAGHHPNLRRGVVA